jgi:hypothetical protein
MQDHDVKRLPKSCRIRRKFQPSEKVPKSMPFETLLEAHGKEGAIWNKASSSTSHLYWYQCFRTEILCVQEHPTMERAYVSKTERTEGEFCRLTDEQVCNLPEDTMSLYQCLDDTSTDEHTVKDYAEVSRECTHTTLVIPDIVQAPLEGFVRIPALPVGISESAFRWTSRPGTPLHETVAGHPISPWATIEHAPHLPPDVERELKQRLQAGLAPVVPHMEGYPSVRRNSSFQRPIHSAAVSSRSPGPDTTITFQQLNAKLQETYNMEDMIQRGNAITIDIVSAYLKGQKMLYVEAKVYCEQYLYSLMIPAICITALCSILSLILQEYRVGPLIVSSLASINSVILALVTYLKLDAKAEAHKTTAYSFEKLQSYCEFSSGRLLFRDAAVDPCKLIEEIGNEVKEIKEKNQFLLPQRIRYSYPILYSTNIFSEVKRLQNEEILHVNDLKTLINETSSLAPGSAELEANLRNQKEAFHTIITFRQTYIDIDKRFKREIEDNIQEYNRHWHICNCLRT